MAKLLNHEYALELTDIYKAFYNNPVLKGISFGIEKGAILGLLGGNGAGKSTLMKIVTGVYHMDSGRIAVNGEEVSIRSPHDARSNGIAMVYQELSLIPTMTVVQNLFLYAEPHKGLSIDEQECLRLAKEALREFGIEDIELSAAVGDLPIGKQQLIEIIKALLKKPYVLILDEPTASLTQHEIELLFDFLKKLKAQGISIILISHHMQEIMKICDRAVVLRNGTVALDEAVENLSVSAMVEAMIGRKIQEEEIVRSKPADYTAAPLMGVQGLKSEDGRVDGVDFNIYPGEVVGIAGLMGSGRTELIKSIYGLQKIKAGKIQLNGRETTNEKPWKSIKNGIFMIPEDRRRAGIVAIHSIKMNLFLSAWDRFVHHTCIDDRKADAKARELIGDLAIKSTGTEQELQNLSGGNQQKVVFGKSIFLHPEILMLDDPTVGVDVEAKDGICRIIAGIADSGSGILLVSSEFDQLSKVCDRVLIIKKGKIIGELKNGKDDISEAALQVAVQS